MSCCCFLTIHNNEQAIIHGCTDRRLITGPMVCYCVKPCLERGEVVKCVDLKTNQYSIIRNSIDPEKDRCCYGPQLLKISSPWEYVEGDARGNHARECPILDQDDFITVKNKNGEKRNIKGQAVYKPELGDVLSASQNTVQVPMNYYIIVADANDEKFPIKHMRGPLKFFPEAFQTIVTPETAGEAALAKRPPPPPAGRTTLNEKIGLLKDIDTSEPEQHLLTDKQPDVRLVACHEITKTSAIHLQKADGTTVLIDTPQFYMPEVGEKILKVVERNILLLTDFCIVKGPSGIIDLMDGKKENDRAFFLRPFHSLVNFDCDGRMSILTTLPVAISHQFSIRTADNVILLLDMRISFQIQNISIFSSNPIEFYGYIRNNIQNDLLDRFSQFSLRLFMTDFAKEAQKTIEPMSAYFQKFGITILDVQILNYACKDQKTQELLNRDIHTTVNKQNELKAAQNDVLIKEQENEILRKKKDMEVVMAQKDNEVHIQRKIMDNNIRMKEVEIDIQEEIKRTELLEVRRGNQLVEAEFEGRARGSKFREFCDGIDPKLSSADKVTLWLKQQDLEQAKILYAKVNKVGIYPPSADLKLFTFDDKAASSDVSSVKEGVLQGLLLKQSQ